MRREPSPFRFFPEVALLFPVPPLFGCGGKRKVPVTLPSASGEGPDASAEARLQLPPEAAQRLDRGVASGAQRFLGREKSDGALAALEKAVALDRRLPYARYHLVDLWQKRGEEGKSRRERQAFSSRRRSVRARLAVKEPAAT